MTGEERLATIFEAIGRSGVKALVMGGHAVRFYGVERNTIDYDLHIASAHWDRLPEIAALAAGQPVSEAPSWRPRDFRRFIVGRLPDGREERLEFWRKNHLLAPFPDLYARREEGTYAGKTVAFLGIIDLIRSKETEREGDWRDIEALEEIRDERALACAVDAKRHVDLLAGLRSRKGFELATKAGKLEDPAAIALAWEHAAVPVARAYLAPFLRTRASVPSSGMTGEILERLHEAAPGSPRHLALVEAVRRLYKREAMEADRKDKMRQASGGDRT